MLGYGSRTFVRAETKYHTPKLEFLALKWLICEQFRDYLFYATYFDVYMRFLHDAGENPYILNCDEVSKHK